MKNNIAKLFSGQCYYRELKAINPEIKFQTFGQKAQSFDLDYVSGKQIKLALVNEFDFDTSQLSGEIELELETINLPYYESIGRSLDLEVDNKLGIWSSDMEVNWNVNDKRRKYTFTNVFKDAVYYHGDVDISQFNFDYNVTITIGETTKEFIWYLEDSELMIIEDLELKPGDIIKYDGIQTFKNGIPINETRMTNPTFKEGWNTFKFNQDVRKVVFDMKFYYK
ncbi:phage tail protein [Mammaliicoccus sciuri]